MKAAIIDKFGAIPQYRDFSDPIPAGGETLVHIKASVLNPEKPC